VNVSANVATVKVTLPAAMEVKKEATRIVLSGEPMACNTFDTPGLIAPRTEPFAAAHSFELELPASSFTLIRMKTR
jgi:alpha-L-arabinofuranosidase